MMSMNVRSTNRSARAGRHSRTRSPLYPFILGALFLLGCHGGGSSSSHATQQIQGHLAWANNLQVQVRVDSAGNLVNLRTLPLDPAAKITLDGKAVAASQLPSDAKVTLTRDLSTHRVVEIEAER